MRPNVKLPKVGLVEISTAHITEGDGKLISMPSSPLFVCELHSQSASLFLVPLDEDAFASLLPFGYSAAFMQVMALARKQGATYIMFDGDGPIVEGLPKFDW